MESQRCKGAKDLLPGDMERFRQVEDAFRVACLRWGYREIRTPTLEYIHLFTAAGTLTPSMLGRVYSFLDWDGWGGERVVLRPDGTIPAARLYSENLAGAEMARLYYVTNVFAFEETGSENREKWQCGVELLGGCGRTSDAEVVSLAMEVVNSLRLPSVELKLSHAGILKALIGELKLGKEARGSLLDEILEGNWQAFSKVKSNNRAVLEAIAALMKLKGESSGFLANLRAMPGISSPVKKQIDNLVSVTSLLDILGTAYSIDFTSIRGFEYYTGLCFKITAGGTRLCSGGRYDNLIGLVGGRDVPACGFAYYLDAIMDMITPWSSQKAEKTASIAVLGQSGTSLRAAFEVADALRAAGLTAEFDFCGAQMTARWRVTANGRGNGYTVSDKSSQVQKKVKSAREVIDIIGGYSRIGS